MTQNLPAVVEDALAEYGTGLEDISAEDVQIPRITINHGSGVFKDRLTGEEFAEMHGILLGMVKQRVMWHPEISENSDGRPQCKSSDAQTGYPNMDGPRLEDKFPWDEALLDPNSMPIDEHNRITIACATCPFAKWGEKKPGKTTSTPPRCSERHTYPIMYTTDPGQPIDRAGIFSVQRSGIKDSKTFLAGFVQSKMPLFSAYVNISLDRKKRGMVDYAIAKFKKTGAVDQKDWPDYAKEYNSIREFLRQPPRFDGDDDGGDTVTGSAARMPVNNGANQQASAQGQVVTPTLSSPTTTTAVPTATPAPMVPAVPVQTASVIDAASEVLPSKALDDELPF